jgi:hypothetical protein
MVKSTQYLYDINPKEFEQIPYAKAIEYKITKAKALLSKLVEPDYKNRNEVRINAVQSAIEWNKQLLKELKADTKNER